MPDFYYIEFIFSKDRDFGEVVQGCLGSMVKAGCTLRRVNFQEPPDLGPPYFADGIGLDLDEIGKKAGAYLKDRRGRGRKKVSFPPWGRVVFWYNFYFGDILHDDLADEEQETGTSAREIGVSFSADDNTIKMDLSLWEEYVLTHGSDEYHIRNMGSVLRIVESIYDDNRPLFGALNSEIAINSDRSMENLMNGRLPEGNDFVIVGSDLVPELNRQALESSGFKWKEFGDGGVVIQFTERWSGRRLPGSSSSQPLSRR